MGTFSKNKKNEYMSTDKLTERVGDIYISFIFQKEVFGWIKETFFNLIRIKKFCGRGHIFTQFNFSPQFPQ